MEQFLNYELIKSLSYSDGYIKSVPSYRSKWENFLNKVNLKISYLKIELYSHYGALLEDMMIGTFYYSVNLCGKKSELHISGCDLYRVLRKFYSIKVTLKYNDDVFNLGPYKYAQHHTDGLTDTFVFSKDEKLSFRV